ncbi:MAG TPA: phospholipase D-like domain-containing protein [Bryobacteraceae bacterium]|nr:phospholipase D-like domain-containing protein [Bryobacteraceae bacterium]
MDSTAFIVIAVLAILAQALTIFIALFEPTLQYKILRPPSAPLDSDQFRAIVSALAHSQVFRHTEVEVLTNGEVFYEAELEAITRARHSINLEAYIFQRGELTGRFLKALAERARAGVKVCLVTDAVGSFATTKAYCQELIDAGGNVQWYNPFRWHTLPRINNRTHRELLIVDCEIGFVGGAGFADHWWKGAKGKPRWRDTIFRVQGDAVSGLQSVFIQNWLEASGELLTGAEYFCYPNLAVESHVIIVDSSPSTGQSTRARMLFQTLLASAKKSIQITTPYFLPDQSVRKEIVKAIRERGVDVKIIAPGRHSDHLLTRRSSRRLYGDLLAAGARIFEYEPAMIHTKTLVIDDLWCVVGSTNFDHRSFSINDEVNLAASDAKLAARLAEDFARDMACSRAVSYSAWKKRPLFERMHESLGWILERQQ